MIAGLLTLLSKENRGADSNVNCCMMMCWLAGWRQSLHRFVSWVIRNIEPWSKYSGSLLRSSGNRCPWTDLPTPSSSQFLTGLISVSHNGPSSSMSSMFPFPYWKAFRLSPIVLIAMHSRLVDAGLFQNFGTLLHYVKLLGDLSAHTV